MVCFREYPSIQKASPSVFSVIKILISLSVVWLVLVRVEKNDQPCLNQRNCKFCYKINFPRRDLNSTSFISSTTQFSFCTTSSLPSLVVTTVQFQELLPIVRIFWETYRFNSREFFTFTCFHRLSTRNRIPPPLQGHPTTIFGEYLFGRRFEI